MSRPGCTTGCSGRGLGALFNRATLCGAAVVVATLGFLLPSPDEGPPRVGSASPADTEEPTPSRTGEAATNTQRPAEVTQRIAPNDALLVTGRWALSQGVLGAEPAVRTEVEVRYRVDVLSRRGDDVRVRVTTLEHRERPLGPGPTRAVPLPEPRELTCRADRLALALAPPSSRALGLPLPQGALKPGTDWERRGEVNLLGVPVPTVERLACRRQADGVRIVLRGEGSAKVLDTGITVQVQVAGSSLFDAERPEWPRRVECSYLWEVTGGGGDDTASSVRVELTCEEERS